MLAPHPIFYDERPIGRGIARHGTEHGIGLSRTFDDRARATSCSSVKAHAPNAALTTLAMPRITLLAPALDTNPKRQLGLQINPSLTLRVSLGCPIPDRAEYKSPHPRRIIHAKSARGSGSVARSVSHPSSRCTSFNLAAMSISCEQVGRHSPQPTQDVPFRVKAAYSLRARSRS